MCQIRVVQYAPSICRIQNRSMDKSTMGGIHVSMVPLDGVSSFSLTSNRLSEHLTGDAGL